MKRTIFFICIFHVVSALAFSSNANIIEKVINPPTEMNKLIIIGDGSDEGDLSIFLVAKIENPEKIENYELKVFTLFYIYSLQYIAAKDINMSNTVVFNKSEDEDMWNMTQAMPNTMVEITIDNEVSIKITRKSLSGSSVLMQEKFTVEEFAALFDIQNYY